MNAVSIVAESKPAGAPSVPRGDCPTAPPALVHEWLARGEAIVIDVREPTEFAREHIDGASLLPLARFDAARLPAGEGRIVVLHCQSGQRAGQAASIAREQGCAVVELEGGIAAWKKAGFPTIVNPRTPLPVMRQVQIIAGSLVVLGVALGAFVSPWFLLLSAFVGSGLVFAGLSGHCGMAMALGLMPWNRVNVPILGENR